MAVSSEFKQELYQRILDNTHAVMSEAIQSNSALRYLPIAQNVEAEITTFLFTAESEEERLERKVQAATFLSDTIWFLEGTLQGAGSGPALEQLCTLREKIQQDSTNR